MNGLARGRAVIELPYIWRGVCNYTCKHTSVLVSHKCDSINDIIIDFMCCKCVLGIYSYVVVVGGQQQQQLTTRENSGRKEQSESVICYKL